MARPRQWSDIDPQWLEDFLLQQGWDKDFDLTSEALRAEVAEQLDGDGWRTLRQAWKRQCAQDEQDEQDEDAPIADTELQEPAAPPQPPGTPSPDIDQASEDAHVQALRQRALQDWDAFAELVGLPQRQLGAYRKQSASPMLHLQAVAEAKPLAPIRLRESQGGSMDIALRGLDAYRHHCHQRGLRPSLDHARRTMTSLRMLPEQVLQEAWKQLFV